MATTDTTGAAKFTALKTGPVSATGYAYNANSLNTRIVQRTDGVETQRWTMAYNAQGDLTKITDVTGGNVSATMTQHTADGRLLRGTTDLGVPIAISYSPRGSITQISRGGVSTSFTYNPAGTLIQTRAPNNQVIDYVVDATQAMVDVKLNGASITPQMLAQADYPDTTLKALLANTQEWLAQGVQGLMRPAQAQVPPMLLPRPPPAPVFDPRNEMLMRPIGGPDNAMRRLVEGINRLCRCDPNQGYSKASYTDRTFAHLLVGGHLGPVWPTQSYFSTNEKVGQALVDEVIAKQSRKETNGTRDMYWADMNRVVGVTYDNDSASSDKRVATQWVRIVIENSNCSSTWRANEVVTIFPDVRPKQ